MTKIYKSIIIALIIFGAVSGVMSFSGSTELALYFLLLIGGFSIVGWTAMKLVSKIRKKEISHPYLIGVLMTSIIGMMAVAILFVSMKGEGEAAEGALLFSPFVILASVVAGGVVGRIYSRNIAHNTLLEPSR
ncbi:hypothetical protein FY034_00615 [Trichlorobacter lovleyi]|uniref:hypothetical protein n=1 Tax=Trichlorobacter lovleyi TaxID=313985 RepID=UPI00223F8D58|nr:hypothetical protein [Trichlorobacter lovleyi]QOX77504.1 hypothetical protein FY034_00615 [Trichlorobacter lovleyi]